MTTLSIRIKAATLAFVLGTAGPTIPAHADHELQNLDPELAFFLQNNERFFEQASPGSVKADDMGLLAMLRFQDSNLLALRLCAERWDGFEDQAAEAQRRVDLVRRAWIVRSGFPEDVVARAAEDSKAAIEGNTLITDMFLANLERLNATCQQALMQISGIMNFARP